MGLIAYIIWGKGTIIGPVESVQPLRDSIALIEKQRINLELKVDSLNQSYDSLLIIKQTIKIQYRDKIKFVYTADPSELDSIIRSIIK